MGYKNTWLNNHTIDPVTGKTAQRNWSNNNEYAISYGGPIVKGKTFFYTLWEQQIHRERVLVDGSVLTGPARQGIFRYYDGWNPQRYGVANTTTPTTSATRVYTAVDALGNPVPPLVNANGTPYSGAGLMCFSIFGTRRLDSTGNMVPFSPQDCPDGSRILPPGGATARDNNRTAADSTGYIFKSLLTNMPAANYFGDPVSGIAYDGLNTAAVRWVRSRGGNDDGNTTTGLGDHWARKQIEGWTMAGRSARCHTTGGAMAPLNCPWAEQALLPQHFWLGRSSPREMATGRDSESVERPAGQHQCPHWA